MDLVLGLSATSTAVRWVVVEGVTGGGAPIDRGVLDITDIATFDADALLTVVLDANDAVEVDRVHAVGVAWTEDGDVVAGAILDALDARGVQNVVSVSELEAAEALALGIADIAGYDDIGVCVFEPDATLVAVVDPAGVTVDRRERPSGGADDVELAGSVIALDLNDRQLDAIFVVGSADLDRVLAPMEAVAAAPVISSAEADMAMTRGAAVAAAVAVNALPVPSAPLLRLRGMSRTAALTSVLVAASVTLVISLSVALGLHATSETVQAQTTNATVEQVTEASKASEAAVPSEVRAAEVAPKPESAPVPAPPVAAAPAPEAPPLLAQTMLVAAPPAPDFAPPEAAPVGEAPAYVPPAPGYVPPAPAPAYVPPQPQVPAVQPQPRLRDRILERIPIINRFHEPQYEYPTG